MPEYVAGRHTVAAAGAGLLACWLGLTAVGDWQGRRVGAARAAQARVVEEVTEGLARARRLLPAPRGPGALAGFDAAVLRGDYIAALAELETLGLAAGPPPEYWHVLAAAASRMGLDEVRVRLEGRGRCAAPAAGRAEPGAAPDRRGMSAFPDA